VLSVQFGVIIVGFDAATVCAEPKASAIGAAAAIILRNRFLHLDDPTVHAPFPMPV